MSFSLVTASRDEGWIAAVIDCDEWDRLFELARALPNHMTWTATPVVEQGHTHTEPTQ